MLLLKDLLSMTSTLRLATIATITLLAQSSLAQTYSKCNPTEQQCPPDPALGGTLSVDFTSGASDQFTPTGDPTYGSDGASFTIAQSGDSPMLTSKKYIMFGKYEVKMKAAPGQGIVSSLVLQSDDLDEIDWEWVGSENYQAQTNYFGKGQATTGTAGNSTVSNPTTEYHTYGVEWTESQIVWQIDGATVRTLLAADADGQFPQTPCQMKIGAWSGGDPSNAPGTIAWAGGPTDYSAGPYTMVVQSVSITDYSTGTQYSYGGTGGTWTSIQSSGGKINGNVGGGAASYSGQSASGGVANATSYPGWKVNPTTGKVIPPNSAPSLSQPPSSTQPPSVSQAASSSAAPTSSSEKPIATSSLEVKIAVVSGKLTTLTDDGRSLPTGAAMYKLDAKSRHGHHKNDDMRSGGSKMTARWVAAFGTFASAVLMASFLV